MLTIEALGIKLLLKIIVLNPKDGTQKNIVLKLKDGWNFPFNTFNRIFS